MSRWNPAPNHNRSADQLAGHFDSLSMDSKLLHSRLPPLDPLVDPLVEPIYQSSTYRNVSVDHYNQICDGSMDHKRYIYQRLGHRTGETAEVILNELEGGAGSLLFSSGLSACTTVLTCLLKAGDHLIAQRPIYSGVQHYIEEVIIKFGVEVSWVLAGSPAASFADLVKPNTRMIYCETPCNPNMAIADLEGLGKLSDPEKQRYVVVDGTFASPLNQQPVKLGLDISIHSCSKYLGGHTDIIAGCLTAKDLSLWRKLKSFQQSNGSYLAPFDSFLLVRGMKTLHLRIERHNSNAMAVAAFLESHPKVKNVFYPGLKSHPQHVLASKQMAGFGGMISFEMKTLGEAKTLVDGLKLIVLAVSLGGPESLIEHPASMTHGRMLLGDVARRASGISDGLIRFSVGLEDHKDIIADLTQSLDKI